MSKPRLVVLSGAGISAESGIRTFRDSNGLWEGHDVMEVASPEGWRKNPQLVTEFYNQRRLQLADVSPNAGHTALVELEQQYDVVVITQNVDDLHERAGSSNIIHLHGSLPYLRSSADRNLRYHIGYTGTEYGALCEKGSLLRPDIVWFGEDVPMIEKAIEETAGADIFLVVGTSLEVYPAAGLLHYVPAGKPIYIIDPNRHSGMHNSHVKVIQDSAAKGLPELAKKLMNY